MDNNRLIMEMTGYYRGDAFEKREQMLKLRSKVMEAEQERMDGAPTISVSEARGH